MYEPKQYLSALHRTEHKKIYAKISLSISKKSDENIPFPSLDDITSAANNSGGKDITINLRVLPSLSETPTTQEHIVDTEILNPEGVLDMQGIIDAIDTKLYKVTTIVSKNGTPEKTTTGTISSSSDIEIE